MSTDGEADESPADQAMPIFPQALPGQIADEDEDLDISEKPQERLCSMPLAEARELCARLESEGLPSDLETDESDESFAIVLVRQSDLRAAQELMESPVEVDSREIAEEEKDDVDRCERNWICPKCRVRSLEVRPTPSLWVWLRLCFAILLVSPVIVSFIEWLFATSIWADLSDADKRWLPTAWFVLLGAFLFSLGAAPRNKYCPKCGWQPDDH